MSDVFIQIVPMLLIFGLFWFILIRPQAQERDAHQRMLAALVKDDRIVTWGGIHGKIVSVADTTVSVEIAKGTQITLEKPSVLRKVQDASITTNG